MLKRINLSISAAVLAVATLMTGGCTPQSNHPNQLNRFDGAAYDSLVLAHGSLVSLRTTVQEQYPALAPSFNKVAEAYQTAVAAYSIYRNTGATDLTMSTALHNLTLALVLLEGELEADLHRTEFRSASAKIGAQSGYAPSELLTALQLAATIASIIPQTAAEARAAEAILAATRQALTEWRAVANTPINLAWLTPIEPIE